MRRLLLLGTVERTQKVKLRNTNFQSSWATQNSAALPGFRACTGPGTGSPRLAPASALQDLGRSSPCSAPPLHHSRKEEAAGAHSQQLGACPRILPGSDPPLPHPSRLEANLCSPRLSSDELLPIWHWASPLLPSPSPPQRRVGFKGLRRGQGLGGCSLHPDACGLLERRASPQYPPSPRSSASPAAAPAQPLCSHPRRRDLLQTKRKRGMARGAGAPCTKQNSSPAALGGQGLLRGLQMGPQVLPTQRCHIHTLWLPLK